MDLLARAAERAAGDDFFVARQFRQYAEARDIATAEVAALLGCDQRTLVKLALCRAPSASDWLDDVRRIAEHGGVDVERLAGVLLAAGE